jgi:type II secretion system protein G
LRSLCQRGVIHQVNNMPTNIRRGFTLVELLIVVSILGILAALVVPRLSASADSARANGAVSQLTTVRKQLEIWKLHHGGDYPTLAQMQDSATDWGVFTSRTTYSGTPDANGDFGPYFPSAPLNPYTYSSLVVAAGAPVISAGWTYDDTTGVIRIILPVAVEPASTDLTAGDFEQP